MSGWPAVALILLAQLVAAGWLIRLAARRWPDYLAIAALTAALLRLTLQYVTGDVSRYLPDVVWSGGSESKEQVIYASAASSILLPLIMSALMVWLFQQARRAWRGADHPDED
jgi:hypothetical protein